MKIEEKCNFFFDLQVLGPDIFVGFYLLQLVAFRMGVLLYIEISL